MTRTNTSKGRKVQLAGHIHHKITPIERSLAETCAMLEDKLAQARAVLTPPGGAMKTPDAQVEYSMPMGWGKWAQIFGMSAKALRELRERQAYHFDQVSPRRWRLPLHELPAEYIEKYRQYVPGTTISET